MRTIISIAFSMVTVMGSSSLGSEAYFFWCSTYGPNLPAPITTGVPSNVPTVRGSLNSSSASSSVMLSMLFSAGICANCGLFSSSADPICTAGPKRHIFTYTGLPVFGSLPKSLSPALCSERSFITLSTTGSKSLSKPLIIFSHSALPSAMRSNCSSTRAVKL